MSWQGNYTVSLPRSVTRCLLIAFALEVLCRGIGLIIQDSPRTSLTLVEAALPLDVWGVISILTACVILAGVILKRAGLIFYGSTTIMALYLTLGWGAILRVAELGWPWNGFKTVTTLIILGLAWGLVAHGTRVMMRAQAQTRAQVQEPSSQRAESKINR